MKITDAQMLTPIALILRWWIGELRACLPGGRSDELALGSRALIVRMSADEAIFIYWKGRTAREIGRLPVAQAEGPAVPKRFSRIRRKIRRLRNSVVLRLPCDCVLRRKVSLPLATQENLREVIGFEMERLTAFREEEVYYSHRLTDINQSEKRITVDLVAVPRTIADRAVALISGWGLRPVMITPDDDELSLDRVENLLPKATVPKSPCRLRRLLQVLALAAIALGAASFYQDYRQDAQLLADYEGRLAELQAATVRAAQLRERLSELIERSSRVIQQKNERPMLIEVLDETTRLLPDNTWVTHFRLNGDQLTLSGNSAGASALIEALERSPRLSQVKFSSPITFDPRQGVERFNLSAAVSTSEGER